MADLAQEAQAPLPFEVAAAVTAKVNYCPLQMVENTGLFNLLTAITLQFATMLLFCFVLFVSFLS